MPRCVLFHTYPDIIKVPANVLYVDRPVEGDPAAPEEAPLRQRVLEGHAYIPWVTLTHLKGNVIASVLVIGSKQGLSQDPSYLSVVFKKTPAWTGKNFYDDFPIFTF